MELHPVHDYDYATNVALQAQLSDIEASCLYDCLLLQEVGSIKSFTTKHKMSEYKFNQLRDVTLTKLKLHLKANGIHSIDDLRK